MHEHVCLPPTFLCLLLPVDHRSWVGAFQATANHEIGILLAGGPVRWHGSYKSTIMGFVPDLFAFSITSITIHAFEHNPQDLRKRCWSCSTIYFILCASHFLALLSRAFQPISRTLCPPLHSFSTSCLLHPPRQLVLGPLPGRRDSKASSFLTPHHPAREARRQSPLHGGKM